MRPEAPGPQWPGALAFAPTLTSDSERDGSGTVTLQRTDRPWLQVLWDQQGSDLLLVSGSSRGSGSTGSASARERTGADRLRNRGTRPRHAEPDQEAILEEHQDVDFSLTWQDKARLRGSAFHQRGDLALALRMIPSEIPSFEELGLPPDRRMAGPASSRPRPRDRSDGFGQVHDTGIDHRPHQRDTRAAHPHHRGPDRIRPPPQAVGRQPARDRPRQPVVRACAALRPPGGPRRPPGR